MDNKLDKLKKLFASARGSEAGGAAADEAASPSEDAAEAAEAQDAAAERSEPAEIPAEEATVVVPVIGAGRARDAKPAPRGGAETPASGAAGDEPREARGEAAEDGDPSGDAAGSEDDVASRGKRLLEKLDSMLYNPENHSDDVDGIDDEDPSRLEERDFEPIRPRRDGKTGCLGGLMYFAFVVSLSVLLACLGWMAATDVLALNKEPMESTITLGKDLFEYREEEVERDDGSVETVTVSYCDMDAVAGTLKAAGIIEYKWLFKAFCWFSNATNKVDPGTYTLTTSLDYRALVSNMQTASGSMVTTTITFPEGFSMQEIFERLEENDIATVEDLYDAAAEYSYNYSFLDWATPGDAARLEGYLFPDTYEFYQGMQASSAINRFLLNFHGKLTADMYAQADGLGITLHQAVIIASMIESEAANDSERAQIASVIYNRLAADMPLQIDATVMYALGEHKEYLTEADLQVESPYNTYLHTGLPAGPICNPGLASINAALKPADTDYLFYALDTESGTHRFFNNYSDFEAFTATQNYADQ